MEEQFAEIEAVSAEIARLSTLKPADDLPVVPPGPTLARGRGQMWTYYQYQLADYNRLQNLPDELSFLESFPTAEDITQRVSDLRARIAATRPQLHAPMTLAQPPSWEDMIQRAQTIGALLKAEQEPRYDPQETLEQIQCLQSKLMDLEEQYLK